jgi:CHAD domain-containing protein
VVAASVATMISATRALQRADGGEFDLTAIVGALSARFVVVTGSKQLVRRKRLDTFDRRLHAAGFTLEHQIVDLGERLVLGRLDGSSTVVVPVKGLRWPATADVLPLGPVREAIAPVTGVRALMVASDEQRRMRRLELCNEDGKTVARVELDEPASPAAEPAQLMVCRLRGYDEQARRADRLLLGLGLRAVENGEDRRPSPAPKTSSVDRAVPARVLLTTALSDFLVTMRENLPGLLDDVDTEFLHDFRVAVRRTRTTLKLGRPALPEVMRSRWEPAFKRLGDLTTPLRDLDVYELDLPTVTTWLVTADPTDLEPLATHLRSRRTAARQALVRFLRSARFRRLVTEWDLELAGLVDSPEGADRERLSAGQLADRSVSRAYRRVARGGVVIRADSPAQDLHELRKRCKELRYALEVFAPVLAEGPRKRAVADLKDLQDVLGRFQDCEVQRRAMRGFVEEMMTEGTRAGAVLAMGELIGHLDAEQDQARREFYSAFARFARPSSLRLMHRLGGGR